MILRSSFFYTSSFHETKDTAMEDDVPAPPVPVPPVPVPAPPVPVPPVPVPAPPVPVPPVPVPAPPVPVPPVPVPVPGPVAARVPMFGPPAIPAAAPVLNPLLAPLPLAVPAPWSTREADIALNAAELAEAGRHINGVIPPGHYFSDEHNPKQSNGVSYLQSFVTILGFVHAVAFLEIPEAIHTHTVIGAVLHGYEQSIIHGMLVEAWFGCCYGWNVTCNISNHSIGVLNTSIGQANIPREVNHMNDFGFQVLRYMLNFVIPLGHPPPHQFDNPLRSEQEEFPFTRA